MQSIPSAAATLLKSRKMVGQDRPACEVTIGGMPTGLIDFDYNAIYAPVSVGEKSDSAVLLADGRVLYVYSDGTWIKQGYAASVEAFIGGDGSVASITTIFANLRYACSTVFWAGDELCLLTDWGDKDGDKTGKVLLYKSALKDGSDWALYSTLSSITWSDTMNWGYKRSIGVPFILPSGRWVLALSIPMSYAGMIDTRHHIYTSDDAGLTWTDRKTISYGPGGTYTVTNSRSIGYFGGNLYAVFTTDYGGLHAEMYSSADNGATWTLLYEWTGITDVPSNVCFIDSGGKLYMVWCDWYDTDTYLWSTTDPDTKTAWADENKLWTLDKVASEVTYGGPHPIIQPLGNNYALMSYGQVLGFGIKSTELNVKSISIDRSQGMAAQATVVLDNKGGQYSPDSTGDWAGVLMPNVLVTIKQGYGADLVQTFIGYIDTVEMSNFPAELRLTCRDKGKLALDRIVTNSTDGGHYVKFTNSTLEAAFSTLAALCGLITGTVETTGLTVASKVFSWESYADAYSWLADLAGFTWYVDELGTAHFVKDEMPTTPTTAYSFAEGEDIIQLGYTISDADLYYQAVVYGKDSNDAVISATADFGAPLTYGLFSQKVLKIDASEADTAAKCQAIADRAVALMLCRARVVDFAAIAVPWLQIGDFIQVTESTSTISELYRITDLGHNMGPDGYTMTIKCYWYGEVPS